MKAARREYDWEGIEFDFRAGLLSLRAIAGKYGLTDAAIRKRSRRDAWERDLTEKVKQSVRTKLVRTVGTQREPQSEKEAVASATRGLVDVVYGHREFIAKLMTLTHALYAQLADAIAGRETFEASIHELTKDERSTGRNVALMRAVALPAHVSALRELAISAKTLIGMERQAFGITDLYPSIAPDRATTEATAPSEEALAKLTDLLTSAAAPA